MNVDGPVPDAIITRRTSLRMDPDQPVEPAIIEELCRLATWAPNHHRTEPWRFAVFTGEGRALLGNTIADEQVAEGTPPERVAKTRVKYLRAPVMLLVGMGPAPDEHTAMEDRDAVAAGIQNLLLGATSAGLASFWSSVATPAAPTLLDLCDWEEDALVVAAVYLGHPTGQCPPPERTPPQITWRDS